MDLGNIFAIGSSLLPTAAMIGVSILLWNAFRSRRDLEVMPHARDASQRLSEDRRHHPA